MRRLIPILFLIFALILHTKAQNVDPIVMTIGGYSVLKSDIERAYNKSNSIQTREKESFKDFVKSYTDVQLILREAREQKIDTLGHYKEECEELKKQLLKKHYGDSVVYYSGSMMIEDDAELQNIIKDYNDGLLLYEAKDLNVWQVAKNDKKGLSAYFKKNKKKYKWQEPRYKGVIVLCKTLDGIKAVESLLDSISINNDVVDIINSRFNHDTQQVLVDYDVWIKGRNKYIDNAVFDGDTPQTRNMYPFYKVAGKLVTEPEDYEDVLSLVESDYQSKLEKDWIKSLHTKYDVHIDKSVLKSIK